MIIYKKILQGTTREISNQYQSYIDHEDARCSFV